MQATKKFKTFTFYVSSFWIVYPARRVFWKFYILQQKDKWQVNKVTLRLKTLKSNKVWQPHHITPHKNFLSSLSEFE